MHLNANSILEITDGFTTSERVVRLKGEAYFEVAKDSSRPFIIKTDKSLTTVLGTKFNLSAYETEQTILTLNEGKVSFSNLEKTNNQTIIVLPNEQVAITNKGIEKNVVMAKNYNSWVTNNLFFNENLKNVFNELIRKYNVEIEVKDKLLLTKIYKGYHKQPSLKNILQEISFVMDFKYKIHGKQIVIY